jgi:hypothetical protein
VFLSLLLEPLLLFLWFAIIVVIAIVRYTVVLEMWKPSLLPWNYESIKEAMTATAAADSCEIVWSHINIHRNAYTMPATTNKESLE